MLIRGLVFYLSLFVISAAVNADTQVERRLEQTIEKALPDLEVTGVSPGPVAGLHEVRIGPTILYVSDDGRYLIKGDVFDLKSLRNISQRRREIARVEAFADADDDSMIEFAPSNGDIKRTVYVYTDIDCGYCRKMHLEVDQLTKAGIAVRYLAFPRSGIGGDSYNKAVSVWCASDRQQALTDSKAGKKMKTVNCPNPVKTHYELGQTMGVRGTPAVYSDTGESIGGYVPANELIRLLITKEG